MKKIYFRWILLLGFLLSAQLHFGYCYGQGFFSDEVNRLIDENYEKVKSEGWSKLVIPASMYDQSIIQMPQYHVDVMKAMNALGFKTYVNGGAVRDGILGTPIHDVDFSTDATPAQMQEMLTGFKVEITIAGGGQIAQVRHENGDKTDMVPIRGINVDLKGKAGFPPNGTYGPFSKDLLDDTFGRDLTFNSLYYDFETGDIIDYHGGLHDLREHIIRPVYDIDVIFPTDPTVIIRAIRFAARYNFQIDEATGTALREYMHCCEALRADQLSFYITKGFTDGCQKRTFQFYLKYGLLDHFLKTLKDYLHDEAYQNYLFPTFDYFDEEHNRSTILSMAALFMPVILDSLGTQSPTLENITATWNKLEEESGQKEHFAISEVSSAKSNMLNIVYTYKLMISDSTLKDEQLVAEVMNNDQYRRAYHLLQGSAKSDSSLEPYTQFWKYKE